MTLRPHALVVGIDGLRFDRLAHADTPRLDAFLDQSSVRHGLWDEDSDVPTLSGPGWTTLLTGVGAEHHGVLDNDFAPYRAGEHPDLLTQVVRAGRSAHAVLSWPPLGTADSGGPLVSDEVPKTLLDGETRRIYQEVDPQTAAAAAAVIEAEGPDLTFVYIGVVDHAGHGFGAVHPIYGLALGIADACVGTLVDAVDARPADEDWLVVVTTDHGHLDEGGHGGRHHHERAWWVALRGRAFPAGPGAGPAEPYDVAPTVLAHLGLPVAPLVRGRPLA